MNNELEITTEEKINIYADMKAKFEALKKAFEAENAELIEAMENLENDIETDVLKRGSTVRGETMMAVWNSGKTTWNGKQLKKFAEKYPEIVAASKVGNPTVSFRIAKAA